MDYDLDDDALLEALDAIEREERAASLANRKTHAFYVP